MKMLRILGELIFPPRCVACGKRMAVEAECEAAYFCPECEAEWQREQLSQCPECFSEFYRCRCQPRTLQRAGVAAFVKLTPYIEGNRNSITNRLISTMKHSPRKRPFAAAAADLAPLVTVALQESGEKSVGETVLVHLPRARRSVRKNGFDHARYLAKALSIATDIPHRKLLIRLRDGKEQKKLSVSERIRNVKGAFAVRENLTGLRILLVDDVVTTGASAGEAAKMLRAAGAAEVTVVALSHTPKKSDT